MLGGTVPAVGGSGAVGTCAATLGAATGCAALFTGLATAALGGALGALGAIADALGAAITALGGADGATIGAEDPVAADTTEAFALAVVAVAPASAWVSPFCVSRTTAMRPSPVTSAASRNTHARLRGS